jgi:exopolyphosphatase/guanosine-5'-triphosphate,3'-diphosphate pyrophosphatase
MESSYPQKESGHPETAQRRAVIDVGTNAIKLLVADVVGEVYPVLKLSLQTHLGRGAFRTGYLRADAVARTTDAVVEFAEQARALDALSVRVVTTSATREARNADDLLGAIQQAAGLNPEIITGSQEAEYVFRGVTSDAQFAGRPLLIVDVGGGSTEWVVGHGCATCFTLSTSLGTTRLLDQLTPSDPPSAEDLNRCRQAVSDFVEREVRPSLQPVLASFSGREIEFVGLGGALKTLARISARACSSQPRGALALDQQQLHYQVEQLWRCSSRERRQLPGLDPEKADVILAGAVIYETAMGLFGFKRLMVSTRGLRTGVLLEGAPGFRDVEPALRSGSATLPEAGSGR